MLMLLLSLLLELDGECLLLVFGVVAEDGVGIALVSNLRLRMWRPKSGISGWYIELVYRVTVHFESDMILSVVNFVVDLTQPTPSC